MAWNSEEVKDIIEHLGPVPALWLLALIEKNVGTGKAHNYTVFPGKIQSIAKDYNMNPPRQDEISDAFNRLNRAAISTPDGQSDTIIVGDKQEYVKLTDHGLTLVTLIDNSPEVKDFLQEFLGDEPAEEEIEFPAPSPEEAPIQFEALSRTPIEGENKYQFEAVARFQCPYPDCRGQIENEYNFVHPLETWDKDVEASCPECGEVWEYKAGVAWDTPESSSE